MPRWAGISLVLCLCLVLSAACGGRPGARGGGRLGAVRLAVPAPLSGPLADSGRDLVAGVSLAVADAGQGLRRAGLAVEVVPYDEARVRAAVANAHLICADRRVLAVVGHVDSAAAIPASERYQECGLALIAPASTAPELTERGLDRVYRLLPRDDLQADFAAEYAAGRLRVRRAFVIHDGTVYGQGLADAFKRAAEARGVRVVGYGGVRRGQRDFRTLLASVARSGPDLIYFGGMYPEAMQLLSQARAVGIAMPFLGGDGLDAPGMRDAEGGQGVYLTTFTRRLRGSAAGRRWEERFRAVYGHAPQPVAAYAYDAARVALDAIASETVRLGRMPTRDEVAATVGRAEWAGLAVAARFDDRGDNRRAAEAMVMLQCLADGCRIAPRNGQDEQGL